MRQISTPQYDNYFFKSGILNKKYEQMIYNNENFD